MTDFAGQDSRRVVTSSKARSAVKKRTNWFIEIERYLAGAISIGGLLLAWEILSRLILPWLNPRAAILMPPPSLVILTGWELIRSGVLFEHIVASTQRVLIAWGAVCVIAIPLGIAMGWWGRFNRYFNPIIELLRPIPPLAWIPISILWFGIGLQQNIFIIMIGCFFPVLLNTIHGVRGIDPVLIRAARNFCASELMILRRVVLPAALPNIFTGARIGLGVAWMVLVAAELVAATSGLGFMIEDARNFLRTDVIFVGMIAIGFMGIVMEGVLRLIQSRLLVWYHG
ncbi:ABC-type nitrate/sulfonate/bicarbonate transport system permease component [Nitrobacteraceae bacterium AZCC 1564]